MVGVKGEGKVAAHNVPGAAIALKPDNTKSMSMLNVTRRSGETSESEAATISMTGTGDGEGELPIEILGEGDVLGDSVGEGLGEVVSDGEGEADTVIVGLMSRHRSEYTTASAAAQVTASRPHSPFCSRARRGSQD